MSNRRVLQSGSLANGTSAPTAEFWGLADEEFESEVFQPYGFLANPDGDDIGPSILWEIHDDPDNHIASQPSSKRAAERGTVLIHYGENTDIILSNDCIEIKVGGASFKMSKGCIETNMDIKTTGKIEAAGEITSQTDVKAGNVSLRLHTHPTPSGPSGPAT